MRDKSTKPSVRRPQPGGDLVNSEPRGSPKQTPPNMGRSRRGRKSLNVAFAIGGIIVASGLLVGVGRLLEGGALKTENLLEIAKWFESLGEGASLLYGLLYFVLELVAVPALPLTLGSGYLFGLVKGTVVVSIAATAASCVAFATARYALRTYIVNIASRYPKFRAIDRAIGREGFKFVFLLRLSPLLPFSISNYLYGVTSVKFAPYLIGSWVGMLPGTIAYVSAGAAVNALTDLTGGKGAISNVNPVLLVVGLFATVGALVTIGRIASKAIRESEEFENGKGEEVSDTV